MFTLKMQVLRVDDQEFEFLPIYGRGPVHPLSASLVSRLWEAARKSGVTPGAYSVTIGPKSISMSRITAQLVRITG